jgi:hypothetical protein
MPTAINVNLLALSLALTPSDPERAAALLREAFTTAYEREGELMTFLVAAGRLGEWPAALRTASRLLHLEGQRWTTDVFNLAGIFNWVARGLAEVQPETAAVLHGAVRMLTPPSAAVPPSLSVADDVAGPNLLAELTAHLRSDARQIIVEALGEPRMRELSGYGEAMDRDQACAYARTHVDEYLATADGVA